MLRDELEFRIRMRNCLRGIQHLDPETVPARLIQLDAEIEALKARVAAEEPSIEIVPIGAGVRAA